ncbi:type VI secretion system baseplate subunit TssG [Helicobacter hepaticus]|jgi:type VI secretion system protein ImpH|uniref:Type VI secretion protein n=1 Tax=Helicobacter hepaticus (strain ATCC 51449 / 3B1) TaxID=235279 RepID=Q7VJJ9_HELHP|nr:type VI secretion system baseplate subunit TssG [Helicobacter hepaticus]AAP76841.1 conserved hypothetical protein [Helicobacter hepaticus ATCC 51449]
MNFTFYRLIKMLLVSLNREQIFLRSARSLGHAYKEVDILQYHGMADLESKDMLPLEASSVKAMEKLPQNISSKMHTESFVEVFSYFFGLLGQSSPLPYYMLDNFAKNEDDGEGFSLFFDFFNNYLLWLFYDSISLRGYHRSFETDFSDRISFVLLKLLGFSDTTSAKAYLPFAPLILSLRRPKAYIEKILAHNFHLHDRISIVENIPQAIRINKNQQNSLGFKNVTLGKSFLLGSTIYSYQNKILLRIKDLHYQEALDYFPHHKQHNKLRESVIFLTNNEFAIDVRLDMQYNPKMDFRLGDIARATLGFGLLLNKKKANFAQCSMLMTLCE